MDSAETSQASSDQDPLGALMCLAQAGDRAAYRDLLRQAARLLRRALKRRNRYLGDSDIEDSTQDILLAVHIARATYDGERPFVPWLMAIARFRAVDMTRRCARRSAREILVDEYPETSELAETNNTEEAYGDPEALHHAMRDLPQGQRTAIELLKLRELSLKEAAAASGMSIAALKVATHRATRTLLHRTEGRAATWILTS